MSTIHDHVAAAREQLRAAGIPPDEADLDARLIAQRLLGWGAARFFTLAHEEAPPTFQDPFDALVGRRACREPMAYVLGAREFWGLTFEVTPAVLIPRPESEIIVEASLQLFPDRDARLEIADVGTGSGCLAVALAYERPSAYVIAIDVSSEVLAVAARNAGRHGVERRMRFVIGDLLEGPTLDPPAAGVFDLIVSNPPYIPDPDRAALQPEVRDYEPSTALFGGKDGLAVIRRLVPQAARRLAPEGYLLFEFGMGQDAAVRELISSTAGLTMIDLRPDLQGIPRTAIAKRV